MRDVKKKKLLINIFIGAEDFQRVLPGDFLYAGPQAAPFF
jgi:hypothetical protein